MKPKNSRYFLLLTALMVMTGCETMQSTSSNGQQNVQNTGNPIVGAWDALENADAWMRQNIW